MDAREKAEWLRRALVKIAAFDDELANARLAATGSYNTFDEPGSVRIAREILAELENQELRSETI